LTVSETILERVLRGNRGRKLTVEDIIELSKKDEYSHSHHYYSKNGITEAFVYYRISNYCDMLKELYNDYLFKLIQEVEIEDGKITSIVISKNISVESQ